MLNLSAFVDFHARRDPGRLALVYGHRRVSFGELQRDTTALSALLSARGIGAQCVVALLMKNSAAFLEFAIAVSRLGAVLLPLNYRLAADEVTYIVGHADASLVIADREFAGTVASLPGVLLLDDEAQRDPMRLVSQPFDAPSAVPRSEEDLFRLMYTSGTTDRPKGVMHSYANFYWKSMAHVAALDLSANDRLLVVGPLYHVGAFDLPGLAVLWLGGAICIVRDFDAAAVLATIATERITGVWLAPVMLARLLEFGNPAKVDLSSLRWVIGGGERTPERRIRAFGSLFPSARYVDAYGLTETCSGDTMMEAGSELARIGSTGRPVPHLDLTIRDDDGTVLPAGHQGEICVRGPKVFKGYWKDSERTAASFHPGQWFRTGDVGYCDDDGFLFLTDRKKDLIISGGENISSAEIERAIYMLPEIADAAVVGMPDSEWGERPVAVVVLRDGVSLDLSTMQEHCRRHLAGFKIPKALIRRDILPRNPSGKILKRVLRSELIEADAASVANADKQEGNA